MEWVETTGRTLDEATELAARELGVAVDDVELDVLAEARSGLFGRVRQEARVRARVRPTSPRPKAERRPRRSKAATDEVVAEEGDVRLEVAEDVTEKGREPAPSAESRAPKSGRRPPNRSRGRTAQTDDLVANGHEAATNGNASPPRGAAMDDAMSLTEQGDTVREFLEGLVEAFGSAADTEISEVDDDTLEAKVVGDDLGLLIGPKGATLDAVQEIARTVLQRATEPERGARLRVDIGGYRAHRQDALGRFTRQVSEQVLADGVAVALEPMTAPDRKVVHDTVNELEGVASSSEGEDPDRRVVIRPA